ncbi:unnamed protein product [Phytophthora lilii]|uniref:Unnamed protein product n=1 Tax=Phytophthora lilii TaxID=2077276 RepID=A0A9W6TGP5_9STRA|nr:unnamed protein product [Phytophthora lilii]
MIRVVARVASSALPSQRLSALLSFNKVTPTDVVMSGSAAKSSVMAPSTIIKRPSFVHESLEILFTAECLVLTEYLETFVPMFYATFTLVMAYLPSAQYHTEMTGITAENVSNRVQSLFIYALLELMSFVALAILMWRNCGIRALYQLAFVLETQATLVQSKLILCVLMTLTYRVSHFGTFHNNDMELLNRA